MHHSCCLEAVHPKCLKRKWFCFANNIWGCQWGGGVLSSWKFSSAFILWTWRELANITWWSIWAPRGQIRYGDTTTLTSSLCDDSATILTTFSFTFLICKTPKKILTISCCSNSIPTREFLLETAERHVWTKHCCNNRWEKCLNKEFLQQQKDEACLKQRIPATTTDKRHMSKQRKSAKDWGRHVRTKNFCHRQDPCLNKECLL